MDENFVLVDEIFGFTDRELAAGVLRQAVSDQEVEFPLLEFWCAVVDLEPEVFQERLKKLIADVSDGAAV